MDRKRASVTPNPPRALVKELVELHHGSIQVVSTEGKETTFAVRRPAGTSHLDPQRIVAASPRTQGSSVRAYLLEASRWAEVGAEPAPVDLAADPAAASGTQASGRSTRVLVVDDNPDMRDYLARLLGGRWQVELAADGEEALARACDHPPDLVLSDVMMPRMDGMGLLRAMRADPRTREIARLRRAWARELAQVNAELEAFSYSVSHDLRTPLRAIDGFGRTLLADHDDRLDEEGRHYLRRIVGATKRMGQMIDDLLALSRVTRMSLRRESVDLAAVARTIMDDLRERDSERRVDVTIDDGLCVEADGRLLRVLLENLLGNAWKFTSKRPSATIRVGRERRVDESVLFVRAEAEPDRGATIYFTLGGSS